MLWVGLFPIPLQYLRAMCSNIPKAATLQIKNILWGFESYPAAGLQGAMLVQFGSSIPSFLESGRFNFRALHTLIPKPEMLSEYCMTFAMEIHKEAWNHTCGFDFHYIRFYGRISITSLLSYISASLSVCLKSGVSELWTFVTQYWNFWNMKYSWTSMSGKTLSGTLSSSGRFARAL
jgi:hypothetical protein